MFGVIDYKLTLSVCESRYEIDTRLLGVVSFAEKRHGHDQSRRATWLILPVFFPYPKDISHASVSFEIMCFKAVDS